VLMNAQSRIKRNCHVASRKLHWYAELLLPAVLFEGTEASWMPEFR
jgi:hypothetical protein